MYCYLPTLLCRKEDTDLRVSVTAAGGAEGRFGPVDLGGNGRIGYGRRGVEVWRERPREAGASEGRE